MSKTYCEYILHHFRGVTKMVINIDSLGFTANAYGDADASLPALLLLLTIEILTSHLHFIHQLLRRRKIKLILTGDNRLVILRQRHLHSRVILLCAKQNANGRIFIWKLLFTVKIIHIHLQLPQILMCRLVRFQVNEASVPGPGTPDTSDP